MSEVSFIIRPQFAGAIRWSKRGSCGNPGCKDPECCCSFCGHPIGVPEDDPRWDDHVEYCIGCELCEDQGPLILWRDEGKEQAQFHNACWQKIVFLRKGISKGSTNQR
jgi:hypothetical protein